MPVHLKYNSGVMRNSLKFKRYQRSGMTTPQRILPITIGSNSYTFNLERNHFALTRKELTHTFLLPAYMPVMRRT